MFEVMFAQLTGLRQNLVRRIVFEPGGEGLAIACKAIGTLKSDFGSLFLLSRSARPGDKVVDPREVSRVMTFLTVCARIQRKRSSGAGNLILIICLR
jgi:hypothetical protein